MSFILDALKKAEAERQRQTGPTLLEVRVTQPRRRFPLWTLMLAALLGINILLLVVFALRKPSVASAPPSPPTAAAVPIPSPAAIAAAPIPAAPLAAAPTLATPIAPATALAPPAAIAAPDPVTQNPADYEPALPAGSAGADNHAEPPSLSEIGGNMPDLRLDLHVYAARPADRYALINMHRVREGDVLAEGPRVVAIDKDGVELNYRGTAFMLRPQQARSPDP
jgi:general secretion pathway protein B